MAFPYSLSFATNFATSATISATVCHSLPQRQKAPRSTDPRRTNHKKNFGVLQTFGDWITNRVRVWVHSRSSLSASSRRAWISSSESKRSSGMSRIHSWIRAMAPRQCCRSNAKRPRHRGGYLVAFRAAAAALRHSHPTPGALPPDRCDTDVGSRQPHQCPLGAPECTALCPPVGDHTRSIFLDEEMHHLRP